jgi:hypothetical protein
MKAPLLHPKASAVMIRNETLLLIALISIFFSRIIDAIGAPSLINFIHFPIVIFIFLNSLVNTSAKNKRVLDLVSTFVTSLWIFLVIIFASALLNMAGIINAIISYLMLAEPFIFLVAIIRVPLSEKSVNKLLFWFLSFAFINWLLALLQWFLLEVGLMGVAHNKEYGQFVKHDVIQGSFYLSGGGNYISVSISIMVALYLCLKMKYLPAWLRIASFVAAFHQLIISDSRQVFIAFLLAWLFLIFIQVKYLGRLIASLLAIIFLSLILVWCIQNIDSDFFLSLRIWTFERVDFYAPGGEAISTKTLAFEVVPTYYTSSLNWLFGLGPGHTVSRLGGWLLRDYWSLLEPLGATSHQVTSELWAAYFSTNEAKNSTLFNPMFGWSGIWGDLGLLGLATFCWLGFLVWKFLCSDTFSKIIFLAVIAFGIIFTQMEEPGYMLSVAFLIGVNWHKNHFKKMESIRARKAVLS